MIDPVHDEAVALANDPDVGRMLEEICRLSGMGFAALARVTEDRWIACQVVDKIEFGLNAGDELKVATTICAEIRQSSNMVVINDALEEADWRTHPTPIMYGFKSYVSLPIKLSDGTFFGTLCAIDPHRRELRGSELLQVMQGFTVRLADLIERRIGLVSTASK